MLPAIRDEGAHCSAAWIALASVLARPLSSRDGLPDLRGGCATRQSEAGACRLAHSAGAIHPAMLWLNSPSNPTGKVLGVEHLRKVVEWARARNVLVASDECYIELGWTDDRPVSILHPDVWGLS